VIIDDLSTALDHTTRIVTDVPKDTYASPTPCPEYDVRTLMNHMVAGNLMFAGAARGERPDMALFEQDHLGDDPGAAYRRAADQALDAWRRPGVLEEQLAFGGMVGAAVIRLHLTEELVHGWDLASSTGQATEVDAALAETALAAMQQVPTEMLRSGVGFGEEVIVDESAPVHERLVAFLGRDPSATPA
jgi:uncharacterized protein (TIGR03086 family)